MIVKEEVYKEYIIRIFQDEISESPNDWNDENCFLVYEHKQFQVERDNFKPYNIYEWLQIKNQINKIQLTDFIDDFNGTVQEQYNNKLEELEDDLKGYYDYSDYHVFQVNAYIHSGVALSLGNEYPFNDRWDVSTAGFILVAKQPIQTEELTKEKAFDIAQSLIKTWNKYLSGEVYGFEIVKQHKCPACEQITEENIDSCSGYYDEPDEIIKDCKLFIDYDSE